MPSYTRYTNGMHRSHGGPKGENSPPCKEGDREDERRLSLLSKEGGDEEGADERGGSLHCNGGR